MKYYFLLIALLSGKLCIAQYGPDSFHKEIGIGIPYPREYIRYSDQYHFPALNISFKDVKKKDALRVGFTLSNYHPRDEFFMNVGYERRFLNHEFQLLAGLDACWRHGGDVPLIGLGPVIGIIYKPVKRFSFQSEWGFVSGRAKVNNEEHYQTDVLSFQRKFSLHVYYVF